MSNHCRRIALPACGRYVVRYIRQRCPAPRCGGSDLTTGGREALLGCSFAGIDLDNLCAKIAALGMLANSALDGLPVGELLI